MHHFELGEQDRQARQTHGRIAALLNAHCRSGQIDFSNATFIPYTS